MMNTRKKKYAVAVSTLVILAVASFVVIFDQSIDTASPTVPLDFGVPGAESATSNDESLRSTTERKAENTPDTESVQLVFGNGEWAQVSWRGPDWSGPPKPPFGAKYAELHEKASGGDRYAAYSLFHVLDKCRGSFGTQEQLDSAIEATRVNRSFNPAQSGQQIPIESDEMLDRSISRMKSTYEKCEPITSAQTAEANKWLQAAADGGPTDAMNYYASTLDDSKQAVELLEVAWSLGNVYSLSLLGQTYLSQYENGAEPGNNIKAYAAYYASAILEEQSTVAAGLNPERTIERNTNTLDKVGYSLTPSQIELAVADAIEMVRSNKNCCHK